MTSCDARGSSTARRSPPPPSLGTGRGGIDFLRTLNAALVLSPTLHRRAETAHMYECNELHTDTLKVPYPYSASHAASRLKRRDGILSF